MVTFLAVLPFLAGILLKVGVFFRSGAAQKQALEKLDADSKVLSEGQKMVILAVVSLSTASITAASTLMTSLVALLVVALKYEHPWLWACWGFDLLLSAILWFYIKSRKEPYQKAFGLKVGTFILLLSGLLDGVGLMPTLVAARAGTPQNCPSANVSVDTLTSSTP
jgi:hypothetical protein